MPCKRRGGGITPQEETITSIIFCVPLIGLMGVAVYSFVRFVAEFFV